MGEGDHVSGGGGPLRGRAVGACGASMIKPLQPRPWRGGKPYNRPGGRWKCTPSVACGDVFPEGADLLYASPFLCLGCSKHRAAKTSPSGGKYREAGIGVHFPQAQPGLHVFPIAPKARFSGFIIRGAAIM